MEAPPGAAPAVQTGTLLVEGGTTGAAQVQSFLRSARAAEGEGGQGSDHQDALPFLILPAADVAAAADEVRPPPPLAALFAAFCPRLN